MLSSRGGSISGGTRPLERGLVEVHGMTARQPRHRQHHEDKPSKLRAKGHNEWAVWSVLI